MLILVAPTQAQSPSATSDADDHRWAFSATLLDWPASEIAIAKKSSRTTMWLMAIAYQWDRTSDESDAGVANADERTQWRWRISPEWRRYSYRSRGLAVYWGVRPFFSYSRIKLEATQPGAGNGDKTTAFGAAVTLGVEYELLANLSLAIHMQLFEYSRASITKNVGGYGETRSTSQQHALLQQPEIVLRIYF